MYYNNKISCLFSAVDGARDTKKLSKMKQMLTKFYNGGVICRQERFLKKLQFILQYKAYRIICSKIVVWRKNRDNIVSLDPWWLLDVNLIFS